MVSLALAVLLAQQPIVSGDRSIPSQCAVSEDPAYGYTMEKPIKVGGTPMGGPARQRRYLESLRGPGGHTVSFKRLGSMAPDAAGIILDLYQLTYEGLEKPIELYLDLYRWEPPKAPRGLLCGAEIGLTAPPPDPMTAYDKLLDVVLAAADVPRPIPLQPGSAERGMIFDPQRLLALQTRAMSSRGEAPSRRTMPRINTSFVVVANPAACAGVLTAPAAIVVEAGPQGRITPAGGNLSGDALRDALPGVELRAGAIGARFPGYVPARGNIAITYDGSACGPEPARLPLISTLGRRTTDAYAVPPPGLPLTPPNYIGNMTLKVHFSIGPDGVPYDISIVNGDARYADAAVAAVRQWRYEMPMINGAPVYGPASITTDVAFRVR